MLCVRVCIVFMCVVVMCLVFAMMCCHYVVFCVDSVFFLLFVYGATAYVFSVFVCMRLCVYGRYCFYVCMCLCA